MSSRQHADTAAPDAPYVERMAHRRLERSAYPALKSIACRYRRGTLQLDGQTPTYFHKQLAQELVRSLPGVMEIANNIAVRRAIPSNHGGRRL